MKISTASTVAAWVPVALRCLKQFGIDESESFQRANINSNKLLEAQARYNVLETHRLMDLVSSELTVPLAGLELAKYTDANSFGALGFAMLASPTIEDALNRLKRFSPVASTVVRFDVFHKQGLTEIRIQEGLSAYATSRATFDFCLAIMTGFLRLKGGRQASPVQVHVRSGISSAQQQSYQQYFNCAVLANMNCCSLFFNSQVLTKSVRPSAAVSSQMDVSALLSQSVQQWQSSDLSNWLIQGITEALPDGEPKLADLASQLNISARTLQRRLKAQNIFYKDILDQVRQKLSMSYLQQHYSVTETAYLLGFSDTSSFSRAHRRWFNCPPSES
jgi:AraC-like DNA-binding protein